MICFDITDLHSFRNVDNWLQEVRRYCPDETPVFLVGTKSDLQSKRLVSYPTIKAYVEEKGLSYIETSSKTSENIENCFLEFTRKLVAHTNEMKLNPINRPPVKSTVDLTNKTNPVTIGGCMGRSTCSI
jgi:GTPase SAR1 family protein